MVVVVWFCVEWGVQIIDINMGCLVKKVCKKVVGLVLFKDEVLVRFILNVVVLVVEVLVILKICIGWSFE